MYIDLTKKITRKYVYNYLWTFSNAQSIIFHKLLKKYFLFYFTIIANSVTAES